MSARKDDRSRSKKEKSPDDADRTFPNRHRPNIIGGLNRKNNSGHFSLNSPDWYFYLSTFWNFISKRWPIIFFTVEVVLLFAVAYKTYNVGGRLCFCVRLNRSCVSADTGMYSFTRLEIHWPTSTKNHYSPIVIKKMVVDVGQERRPIQV